MKLQKLIGVWSLLITLLLTLTPSAWAAQSVTLAWDASVDTNVTSYVLYYGTASGAYTYQTNVGNRMLATVTNLPAGTWYFIVTARDDVSLLESDPSNEVFCSIPPDNVLVKAVGTTNMTRTNVVLVGLVTNMPGAFSAHFEYFQGTNWLTNAPLVTPTQFVTNNLAFSITALIPTIPTNWIFRLTVTNGPFVYNSPTKIFNTIPPKPPTQIRFEVKIIQASAITSTNWIEVLTASVLKDFPPEGAEGYFKSVMNYAYVYDTPPAAAAPAPAYAPLSKPVGILDVPFPF